MNPQHLLDALSDIREDFIREAAPGREKPKNQKPRWPVMAVLAACLAVVLIAGWPGDADRIAGSGSAGSSTAGSDGGSAAPGCDGAPSVVVDGVTYVVSAHGVIFRDCPEGFSYTGETDLNGKSYPYYTDPDRPEWVYLYQECYDQRSQESYYGYVRYVEETLRGLRLIRHDGKLYARLHDLSYLLYDEDFIPDENLIQRMDRAEDRYGSFLTALPEGFTVLGRSVLEGYDTIPTQELGSNMLCAGEQVLADPSQPDILLAEYPRYAHRPGETTTMEYELYLWFELP